MNREQEVEKILHECVYAPDEYGFCAVDVEEAKKALTDLIDSAKREELELYVKYIENTDKFYPLYASLDRETAIDECRKFASNYGKHRIAQLEQSEESK